MTTTELLDDVLRRQRSLVSAKQLGRYTNAPDLELVATTPDVYSVHGYANDEHEPARVAVLQTDTTGASLAAADERPPCVVAGELAATIWGLGVFVPATYRIFVTRPTAPPTERHDLVVNTTAAWTVVDDIAVLTVPELFQDLSELDVPDVHVGRFVADVLNRERSTLAALDKARHDARRAADYLGIFYADVTRW